MKYLNYFLLDIIFWPSQSQSQSHIFQYLSHHRLFLPMNQYAVKVQRSLAPLSRFRGSHIPSAHEQQCCRFQSYANSVRSPMKFTSRNWHCVNHIPGIHDNGPRDHELWRRTLTAYKDTTLAHNAVTCM